MECPNIQGGPERVQHLRSIISRKRGDRIDNLCALLCVKFFPQQDDTKIVIFYESVLILWPFSEARSFSRFALLSQKSQVTYRKCSIVWLPRLGKVSALAL